MSQETVTLADALPAEIQRCQKLLEAYAAIGPAGTFGATMIRADIDYAHRTMMAGDVVGMLQALKKLQGCK